MLLLLGERIVEPNTVAHFGLSGLGLSSIFIFQLFKLGEPHQSRQTNQPL